MIPTKYNVHSVSVDECRDWLLKKHYAKRLCSVSFSFGLFSFDNVLLGVITFGMPPSSTLCSSICGDELAKNVIELNRLVVDEGLERNVLSFFVATALKKLPKNKIVVSFADANMKHNGYIYQATNFIYTGVSSNTSKLIDKFNKEFHFRNIGHYQKNNKLGVKLIKKRTNEELIDKKKIANYLRDNKGGYTNKELESLLNIPKTTIEHWFRLDKGFSFPDVDQWKELKKVLLFDETYDNEMTSFKMIPSAEEIIKKLELKKVDILPKHRYLFFKGSKSFKKKCLDNLKLNILDYPKGKNERYLNSYRVEVQLRLI